MNYIISAVTDVGISKRTNQDSFHVRVINTALGRMTFAVLCDGMGGLAKGEVASASLVNAFVRWTEERLPVLCAEGVTDKAIGSDWTGIAREFNEKIKRYGHSLNAAVGTTLSALLLTEQRYYIINVGDTRVYEITDQPRVLTRDQTVVAREVELGCITEEQARTDPRRSVLLQCVGASEAVYPDLFFGQTRRNAVYMLCSDGFRHEITANELQTYLSPQAMTQADVMRQNMLSLVELNKQRRERDNITVVSIRTF